MQRSLEVAIRRTVLLAVLVAALTGTALLAQDATPTPSGYADLLETEIRGIDPATIEAYRTGGGAGLALPAELNGYPGPRHVLDLADELELTIEQQAELQALYDEMRAEAVELGTQLLTSEAALELGFRDGSIDEDSLNAQLIEIGSLESALRFVHLRTHLATVDILTPHQVHQYNALRGYTSEGDESQHHHGDH